MVDVVVETWCSQKRWMVKIHLDCPNEPKGEIVAGKPIHCSDENSCEKGPLCLLNCLWMETKK